MIALCCPLLSKALGGGEQLERVTGTSSVLAADTPDLTGITNNTDPSAPSTPLPLGVQLNTTPMSYDPADFGNTLGGSPTATSPLEE